MITMEKIVVLWVFAGVVMGAISLEHVQGFLFHPLQRSHSFAKQRLHFQRLDDDDGVDTTTIRVVDDHHETNMRSLLDQAVLVQYHQNQQQQQQDHLSLSVKQDQDSATALQLLSTPSMSSSVGVNLIGDIAGQLYYRTIAPQELQSTQHQRQIVAHQMNQLLLQPTRPFHDINQQLEGLGREFRSLSQRQEHLEQILHGEWATHHEDDLSSNNSNKGISYWKEQLEQVRQHQQLLLPQAVVADHGISTPTSTTSQDKRYLLKSTFMMESTERGITALLNDGPVGTDHDKFSFEKANSVVDDDDADYNREKRLELEAQISDVTSFLSQRGSFVPPFQTPDASFAPAAVAESKSDDLPFFLETSNTPDSEVDDPPATNSYSSSSDTTLDQDVVNSYQSIHEVDDFEVPFELPSSDVDDTSVEQVDVAIVGAGIGGLCAGAILNTLYGKKVGIYESHYLAGGCAHAFERSTLVPKTKGSSNNTEESQQRRLTFTFDSGPTILLGCSQPPYNPLRQVLNAIDEPVEWIRYDGWGMIERPGQPDERRWKVVLGSTEFEKGPLTEFGGGESAVEEYHALQEATKGLLSGVGIPAMAMRPGKAALVPLLRYFPTLLQLIQQGPELTTGTFAPFLDGPLFVVKNPWLRNWLDALAFSLSGLPACRTSAAAMAFVLYDMHRPGAALDYPRGGLGAVIDALVAGVEKGNQNSKVNLRSHVQSIDWDGTRITGLTLKSGKRIQARDGVICNAPLWSLNKLIQDDALRELLHNQLPTVAAFREPRQTWVSNKDGSSIRYDRPFPDPSDSESLLAQCDTAEMTGSFLHLHLVINSTGLNLDDMEAHYTVMDRSLAGDVGTVINGVPDGPCGELNMIAVSNPCVIDKSLAPEGFMVVHAYAAANEPFQLWQGLDRNSPEYRKLKEERAHVLWRAVESIIPDVKSRVVLDLTGSPLTHERFLRRPKGTYGAATEDYLKDGSTPLDSLVLAGDGVFPGIGVPAVAISGASAANAFVNVFKQWGCLNELQRKGKI